jgi:hypothetical protein
MTRQRSGCAGSAGSKEKMFGSIIAGRRATTAAIRHWLPDRTLRIVCPNGHLGFAPIKTGSFRTGCHCEPDLICAALSG